MTQKSVSQSLVPSQRSTHNSGFDFGCVGVPNRPPAAGAVAAPPSRPAPVAPAAGANPKRPPGFEAGAVIVIFFQLETFGLRDFWNKGVQVGINGAHKDLSLSAKQAPCPGDCFRHRFGAVSHSCGEKRGIGGERKSSRVGGNLVGMEEI